jgi:hypothetical protein
VTLALGTRLGPYEVTAQLGEGGTGNHPNINADPIVAFAEPVP